VHGRHIAAILETVAVGGGNDEGFHTTLRNNVWKLGECGFAGS
jgi:hypothetical protein